MFPKGEGAPDGKKNYRCNNCAAVNGYGPLWRLEKLPLDDDKVTARDTEE